MAAVSTTVFVSIFSAAIVSSRLRPPPSGIRKSSRRMSGRRQAFLNGRAAGGHFDVGLTREQMLEPLEHDRVIVDEDDANAHGDSLGYFEGSTGSTPFRIFTGSSQVPTLYGPRQYGVRTA